MDLDDAILLLRDPRLGKRGMVLAAKLASAMVGLFDDKEKLVAQWTAQAADLAKTPIVAALVRPAGVYRVRVASVDKSGRAGTVEHRIEVAEVLAGPLGIDATGIIGDALGVGLGVLELIREHAGRQDLRLLGVTCRGIAAIRLREVSKCSGAQRREAGR